MTQGTARLDVGSVLSRTFSIWIGNFVPFTILALIVMSPVILYSLLGPLGTATQTRIYVSICSWGPGGLGLITSAAVAYGVFQQMRGAPVALQQCLRVGLARLLPVLGVAITVGFLVVIGLVCLVVPGIILACIFAVAVPAAVVEKVGVGDALARSTALTKGSRLGIFLVMLVLGVLGVAAGLVVDFLIPDPATPTTVAEAIERLQTMGEGLRLQVVVSVIAQTVLGCLSAVSTVVMYHDLRVQKEHVDLEKIAGVFD
jgi:hypothetical protein